MGIQINQAILKIIVQFDIAFNLTQVTNYWNNTLKPALATIIITKLDQGFKAGYILTKKDGVIQLPSGRFEVYGKLVLTAEAKDGVTAQQLRDGVDDLFTDMKAEYRTSLQTNNATNVRWHIHRNSGQVAWET